MRRLRFWSTALIAVCSISGLAGLANLETAARWFTLASEPARAELAVPPLTGPVVDLAGVLDTRTQLRLTTALQDYKRSKGPQIQLLTVPSLEGETIEGFSIRVVDAWKLGGAKTDDGVLLLVALKDRKVRIEVGRGLEGVLTDATTGRIIQERIIPFFREGRTQDGILSGLQTIAETIGGSLQGEQHIAPPKHDRDVNAMTVLLACLIIAFIVVFMFLGGFADRNSFRSSGWGGGWSGGSSSGWGGGGGGGWSGGGGGFSGGGSSGSW